jgi:probable O-glycosylation ligase (exosortase A-associated)
MRDLVLLLGFIAVLLPVFRYPHIGVLIWCWTALVVPNNFVYGFMLNVPFNKITAVVTVFSWLISREPRKMEFPSAGWLLIIFGIWGTVSAMTGIAASDVGLVEWDKFAKVLVFSFMTLVLITSKSRIDALLYSVYLSLGFHGVLEGVKFLVSAGEHRVWGPTGSILGDNNHFALGMVALFPIGLYLYKQAESRYVKWALIGSSLLVLVSVVGTFSRGGLIGIVAVGAYALLGSGKRIKYAVASLPLLFLAWAVAPGSWFERMDTITTASQDSSFMGRVVAWKQSTLIALDHPFFGGGFHAVQDFGVWTQYAKSFGSLAFVPSSMPDPIAPHAAHSIYFQVLGDLGFVGLFIFLAILFMAWRNANFVIRYAGVSAEWAWARQLAKTLQYSLVAYIVAGAALSMAYFDFIYIIFALLMVLRGMLETPPAYSPRSVPLAVAVPVR